MRKLLATTALLLLAPAAAPAATIEVSDQARGATTIAYRASPGEVNAPAVDVDLKGRRVTFTDPGASLSAEAPCEGSGTTASCPIRRYLSLDIELGDGDDRFGLDLPAFGRARLDVLDAGPGDDAVSAPATRLLGGDGDDDLTDGGASAAIRGGAGADTLQGRGGSQTLAGGPGVDTIDAGTESGQTVSFADATAPVTADLRTQGLMGPAGEQDMVTGADYVIGGDGDDTLTGDDGFNDLEGGRGNDVIDGGGGTDRLSAGKGIDRVFGGAGNDEIRDRPDTPSADAVLDGGEGDDTLRTAGSGATLIGGDGNDDLRIDPQTTSADGGEGSDYLFAPKGVRVPRGAALSCGSGVDGAGRFGRVLAPVDCERLIFPHSKFSGRIDNAVVLGPDELVSGVPNLCFHACRTRVDLILGGRRIAQEEVRLPDRGRGTTVTFELSPAQRRAIAAAGAATLYFDPPDGGFIGASYAALPVR